MKLFLVLSMTIVACWARNTYVVISPAKIRPGMDLAMSVDIRRAKGPVNVTASILQSSTELASGSGVFTKGNHDKLHLQIPDHLPGYSYTLKVVGNGGLTFSESKTVSVNKKQISLFIQTDKGLYKPGDTVHFRVFATHPDLTMYSGPMDISITDGHLNKIKQWLKVIPDYGVITKEFLLSSQPVLGDWRIKVITPVVSSYRVITVAEYVLPKFEVQVHMPSYSVETDKDITFDVTSRYTYDKPVQGTLEVSARLHYPYETYHFGSIGTVFNTNVPTDGSTKIIIPMSKLKAQRSHISGLKLSVVANVTESLTGNTLSGEGTVKIFNKGYKLKFLDSNPNNFKPGLLYRAYLKVSQADDLPVQPSVYKVNITAWVGVQGKVPTTTPPKLDDRIVDYLYDPRGYYSGPVLTYSYLPSFELDVPSNGLVEIPLPVQADTHSISLTAKYRDVSATLELSKTYSASESFIQLSLVPSAALQVGDSIPFEVKSTKPIMGNLIYEVLARGALVATGSFDANQMTTFSFSVTATAQMSPNARIVVYYVGEHEEVITDSISFDLSGAFLNKVSVSVNQTEAEPGNTVEVTVTADPQSKAHLLAVDQSVLLLSEGNDVTAEDVYAELKKYDTITPSFPNIGFNDFLGRPVARRKRSFWWPYPTYYGGVDAKTIFENAGVVVFTDAWVYNRPEEPFYPLFEKGSFGQPGSPGRLLQEPTQVRSEFPETWLWGTYDIQCSGSTTIKTTVPDTITSWVASAFAVNDVTGLGVAPQKAHLKVFKPFFVSLNLPYSVIRGEHLALQAIVFNYLASDMVVRVTLAQSDNFFNVYLDESGNEGMRQADAVQEIKVAAGEAKSVYFPIVPADLGKLDIEVKAQSTQAADAVRRQLLVEAEGVPKEYNIPVLIDLNDGQSFHETVAITLPPLTVAGSEFMRISAVGDLMGPTLANLDKLLKMPTGCGEQNMLGLAPDVYITDYLKAVNQLTSEIKDKAIRFMDSGYQRELSYDHSDGSFSAFGDSDSSGSMWLTAFVVRVFRQASEHIFVDDEVLLRASRWMINKQNSDGSFPEPGRVIHKNMQGNTGSGLGLTLYVYISLLQNQDLYAQDFAAAAFSNALSKALAYLETEVLKSDDTYFLALASYAFQLAGSEHTQTVLDKLDEKAIHRDGLTYWHQPETAKATTGTWHSPNPTRAIDTEMTAYVLLTYALQSNIPKGKSILQWVVKQRNPNGGFSSTQDTVVALNALSEFAKLVYSDNFNIHIDAVLDPITTYSFDINQHNALITQSRETYSIPEKVPVTATGHGLALLEVSIFFNVESEVEDTSFLLEVNVIKEKINVLEVGTCASWLGDGPASGMAVQEIGIPSGFEVKPETLEKRDLLKRVEYQDRKIVLYFDEIGTKPVCLTFVAERTGLVAKSQPATVRIYDYYEPDNQMTVFYQPMLLKTSTICGVCKDCYGCIKPEC